LKGEIDDWGVEIDARYPLARERRQRFAVGRGNPEQIVSSLLRVCAVFGKDLAKNPAFERSAATALKSLLERGARNSVEVWV
jgi:mannitol-1-phosphate/altronate dehydrogenase